MPRNENEARELEKILERIAKHAKLISDAKAADDYSTAWHEMEKFRAYLDGVFDD